MIQISFQMCTLATRKILLLVFFFLSLSILIYFHELDSAFASESKYSVSTDHDIRETSQVKQATTSARENTQAHAL